MSENSSGSKYIITSALMGFGHLRAAHNISSLGHAPVVRVDREPNVNALDRFVWNGSQYIHTYASRDAESRNKIIYSWFEGVMEIPEDHRPPSLSASNFVRTLERIGVGKKFLRSLDNRMPTLLHTFYLSAMISAYRDYRGRNLLLLCDTDFHRVWAPLDPNSVKLEYCAPIGRSADRLISYGVPSSRIHVTGFPLPAACTGGRELEIVKADFEQRRKRLRNDATAPLTIMFPFSGAGAYSNILAELVKALLDHIRDGRVRLMVSCGDNSHALDNAENLFVNYGIDESPFTDIMYDRDLFSSFDRFNDALKSVDLIITKPSEMVFYAGLGIPMVFLPPIGAHEAKNRQYLLDNGCAVDIPPTADFPRWIEEARRSDKLLDLAEMGYANLPKAGAFDIDELAGGD